MRLLLDTHIWIWSLLEPRRLSRRVRDALNDVRTERWISPLSMYEAWVLYERGMYDLRAPFELWLKESLRLSPVSEATLTFEVVQQVAGLHFAHRDPIDRLLMASALVYELTLVTSDRRILESGTIATMPNR